MNKKRTGFSANTCKAFTYVDGWRNITSTEINSSVTQYASLYVNENQRLALLTYNRKSFTISSGNEARSVLGISSKYQPVMTCGQPITGEITVRLGSSESTYAGNLALINVANSSRTLDVGFQMIYRY